VLAGNRRTDEDESMDMKDIATRTLARPMVIAALGLLVTLIAAACNNNGGSGPTY
jgi:hypothetical protein